jgi:predicted transcriptional regulator
MDLYLSVGIDILMVKWKNEELRRELMMNTLDYLSRNQNASIEELSDYTGQEYAIIAQLMHDLENEGLIKSETVFNLKNESK